MKKLKPDQVRELRKIIVNALDDLKGQNILALDVSEHSSITDTMIIATGNSNRQVRALIDHAIEEAKAQGFRHSSVDQERKNDWVIADFGSVVLHVLIPEAREYYDLERLWQVDGNVIIDTEDAPAPKKRASRAKVAEVEIIFDKDSLETQTDRARSTKAAPRRKALESVDNQLKKAPLKAGALAKTGIKRADAIKASKEAKSLAKPAAKKAAPKTAKAAGTAKTAAPKAAAAKAAKPAAAKKAPAKTAAKPAAKGAKPYAEKPSASAAKSAGARAARTATKAKD